MRKSVLLWSLLALLLVSCSKKTLPMAQGTWVRVQLKSSISEYVGIETSPEYIIEITNNNIITYNKKYDEPEIRKYSSEGKVTKDDLGTEYTVVKLKNDTLILEEKFAFQTEVISTSTYIKYSGPLPPDEWTEE